MKLKSPRRLFLPGVVMVIALAIPILSQTTSPPKPSFDIASVKVDTAGGPPRRTGTINNRFIAENVPLILLIQYAYRPPAGVLFREHVIGGPSWINTDRFDIEAKVEADTRAIPTEQAWLMVQSLLEDRFQLKVHHEPREMSVLTFVVAKSGVKMKLSEDQATPRYDDQLDVFDPAAAPPRGETSVTTLVSGETILTGLQYHYAQSGGSAFAFFAAAWLDTLAGGASGPSCDRQDKPQGSV